jgi:hypothetical protein
MIVHRYFNDPSLVSSIELHLQKFSMFYLGNYITIAGKTEKLEHLTMQRALRCSMLAVRHC